MGTARIMPSAHNFSHAEIGLVADKIGTECFGDSISILVIIIFFYFSIFIFGFGFYGWVKIDAKMMQSYQENLNFKI